MSLVPLSWFVLAPQAQYLVNSLRSGNSSDLQVLKELIDAMTVRLFLPAQSHSVSPNNVRGLPTREAWG